MFNFNWITFLVMGLVMLFGRYAFWLLARFASMKTLSIIGFVGMFLSIVGTLARLCQLSRGTTHDLLATTTLLVAYVSAALFCAARENEVRPRTMGTRAA